MEVPPAALCSHLEGLGQKVRRKLPEAAAGDDSCVAKVQEQHLQDPDANMTLDTLVKVK